jgi:hypothetical protein
MNSEVSAHYHAETTQALGELGYDLRAGGFEVEPFGGLAYVNAATGGFNEKGVAAALTGKSGSEDITFTSLGARVGSTLPFADGRVAVRGTVAWQHALDNVTPASTLAFNGGAGVPFTIDGIPIATDAVVLEAGLDWTLNDRASHPRLFRRDSASRPGPRRQGKTIGQLLAAASRERRQWREEGRPIRRPFPISCWTQGGPDLIGAALPTSYTTRKSVCVRSS